MTWFSAFARRASGAFRQRLNQLKSDKRERSRAIFSRLPAQVVRACSASSLATSAAKILLGPVFAAIGLDAEHGVQVMAHDREGIDRNRKRPRPQSEPIFNPLAAMVEVVLGRRVGAAAAARDAVEGASGAG